MLGLVRNYGSPALQYLARPAVEKFAVAQGIQTSISVVRSSYRHEIIMDSRYPSGCAKLGRSVQRISDVAKYRDLATGSGSVGMDPAAIRAQILAASRAGWRVPVVSVGRANSEAVSGRDSIVTTLKRSGNTVMNGARKLGAARAGEGVLNDSKACFAGRSEPEILKDAQEMPRPDTNVVNAKIMEMVLDDAIKDSAHSLRKTDSAYGSMERISQVELESDAEVQDWEVVNHQGTDLGGTSEDALCISDGTVNAPDSKRKSENFDDAAVDEHQSEDSMESSKFATLDFSCNPDHYQLSFIDEVSSDDKSEEMWWDDYQHPWSMPSGPLSSSSPLSRILAGRDHLK